MSTGGVTSENPTTGPYAKVIADSIYPGGHRLTTFEVRFHRFVLAEFNTHRVFSRNSASSRAIPVRKQLERIGNDTAFPLKWPSEKKGMQGGDELPERSRQAATAVWENAADYAVRWAEQLVGLGVHKSVVNRILEPFMWHTVIVSATAWGNFFKQRVSPLAQPEIDAPAHLMYGAYMESKPAELKPGQWHLPYIRPDDWGEATLEELKKVSTARCARVSYLTHDGFRDINADLQLYDRLVTADPMHASPLEHVAQPDPSNKRELTFSRVDEWGTRHERRLVLPVYGNFLGWQQHRFEVELERDYQSFA